MFTHMYFRMEDPDRFDYGEWDRGLAENLSAPNIVFREIGSKLRDRASLVTVTSTEAFTGSFGASGFAAAKAAMQSLTKSLANLYGARSIRVNCVAPGWVAGVMDTDDAAKESCDFTPLARLGSTDEVAAAVAFLPSEDSSFITGTTSVVDGGYLGVDPVARLEYDLSRGKDPLT